MNDNWKPADGLLGQIDASKRDCAAIERVLTAPGAAEPVAPFGYMRPADIEAIRSNRGGEWCQAFGVTPVNCWRDGAGDRMPIYTAPPTTSQAGRDAVEAFTDRQCLLLSFRLRRDVEDVEAAVDRFIEHGAKCAVEKCISEVRAALSIATGRAAE